ncbi:MAG: serine protease [Bacteroidota bacterium]
MNLFSINLLATILLSLCLSSHLAANELSLTVGEDPKDSIVLKPKGINDKYVRISTISLSFKNPEKDYQEFTINEGTDLDKSIEEAEFKRFKRDLKQEKRELEEGEYQPSQKGNSITIDNTVFTDEANKMLKNSGYIDTVNILFSDNTNTLFLDGKIIRISEFSVTRTTKKVPTPFFYKFKVTMRWYLKNIYDETIDSTDIVALADDLNVSNFYYTPLPESIISTIQTAVNKSLELALEENMIRNNSQLIENLNLTLDKLILKGSKTPQKKEGAQASSVTITTESGHGSGFAISEEGYIVTNFHVISGEKPDEFDTIKVINAKGEEKIATVVRYNRNVDLALLKVDMTFETPLQLPAAKNYAVLQTVYAIGTPKSKELGQSISGGIISNERKPKSIELIQLSMSVNSGNSGGPVIDDKGALCGVVVSKLFGFGTEGIGFAIPAYKIAEYLNISY